MRRPMGDGYGVRVRGLNARALFRAALPWSALGILLCAAAGCRSSTPRPSRRVDALLAVYAPGVRFGQLENEAFAPASPPPPNGTQAGSDIEGFTFQTVRLKYTWKQALVDEFGGPTLSRRGRIQAVVLMSSDSNAAQRARERVTLVFGHTPDEGCAGLPGVALDRVFYWTADDRGGVALTTPAFRRAGAGWGAQLVLYAGGWDPERTVEIGFQKGACPVPRAPVK